MIKLVALIGSVGEESLGGDGVEKWRRGKEWGEGFGALGGFGWLHT